MKNAETLPPHLRGGFGLLLQALQKWLFKILGIKLYYAGGIGLQTEIPPLPPDPGFISSFKTLGEWLVHICDTIEPPKKPIEEFHFQFWTSNDKSNSLGLVGYNRTKNLEEGFTVERIDFKTTSKDFFTFHQGEYMNLSTEQVVEQIKKQLKEFTTTAKFLSSFLSKGKLITFDLSGDIWSP